MPIHIFKDREGFNVWTEIEGLSPKRSFDVAYGRCIGAGKTLDEAIQDAKDELRKELAQLDNPPETITED